MAYCRNCGINHRTPYCPKEGKPTTQCPSCEEVKKIAENDYLCTDCRDEKTERFDITVPETIIPGLKEQEAKALSEILIRFGMGFRADVTK